MAISRKKVMAAIKTHVCDRICMSSPHRRVKGLYNHEVQLNCILLGKRQYACRAVKPEENTVIWQLTWLQEYEITRVVLSGTSGRAI
jgi:hypothetical protein